MLFSDIPHREEFSINVFAGIADEVCFRHMSNVFHPSTILLSQSQSTSHDAVPGIKTDNNEWNLKPHTSRVVLVDQHSLQMFCELLEDDVTVHGPV